MATRATTGTLDYSGAGLINGMSITSGTLSVTGTITGGNLTLTTDLAVADGGTGASDAATARTNLAAINFQSGFETNPYYRSVLSIYSTGASALFAVTNQLYLIPYYVGATTTFTRIGVRSGAGGVGAFLQRMGIYNVGPTGHITTRILDAGEITVAQGSSVADRETTISQSLTPGWYFLVLASDSTNGRFDGLPLLNSGFFGQNASTDLKSDMYFAFTYGALNADYSASAVTRNTNDSIIMWLRVV